MLFSAKNVTIRQKAKQKQVADICPKQEIGIGFIFHIRSSICVVAEDEGARGSYTTT
jgi:hypothetical protein